MTDYKEEQDNEIEALEAIYPDEFRVQSVKPYRCFEVIITSQSDHSDAIPASCTMQFTYTASYPDEMPIMEIKESECLEDSDVDDISQLMIDQAEENLGMVMVFTIISAVQEKIDTIVETVAKDLVDERDRLKQEQDEKERKKFEGTRCTIETFLAWKEQFLAEKDEQKRIMAGQPTKDKKEIKKLSGRELFMQDSTFDDSDVRFLEEDVGNKVEVDESLFDDMDDMDLNDESLDDLES